MNHAIQWLVDRLGDIVTGTISGIIVLVLTRAIEKRPPKGTGKHYKGGRK